MQAAHDAAQVPLVDGELLQRVVGVGHAGVEEDVDVDAADGNDPEQEPAQRTELHQRIQTRPEELLADLLQPQEQRAQSRFEQLHAIQCLRSAR